MVLAEALEPAACSVAFAVVLVVAILALNGYRSQGDDFGKVGMDQDGPQQLVVVGNGPVAMLARHTMGTVDFVRAEVFDAIQGHEVTAAEENIVLQNLAPLQLAKDLLEDGAQ